MDCKACKEARKAIEPVPYIAHESAMARMERTIKRLWILLIVMAVLLVGTNAYWIYSESQYDDVVMQTVTQDADNGINNFVGGDMIG